MGRLIDADKLDFSKLHLNKSQIKAVLDFVDVQPTAYDVEKVVEQIEQLEDVGASWTHKHIYPHQAIEIVKGGGVNK